jgi:hypothetical protein
MDLDILDYPIDINPFGLAEGRAVEWTSEQASAYLDWRVDTFEARTDVLLEVGKLDFNMESGELLSKLGPKLQDILRLPEFSHPYTGPKTVTVKGHTIQLLRTVELSPRGVSLGRDIGVLMARLFLRDFPGRLKWTKWTIPKGIKRCAGQIYYEHGYHLPALAGFPHGAPFVPTEKWGNATNVASGDQPPTIWASMYTFNADSFRSPKLEYKNYRRAEKPVRGGEKGAIFDGTQAVKQ